MTNHVKDQTLSTSGIFDSSFLIEVAKVVTPGLHCRFSLACVSYIQFDDQGLISKVFGEIVHRADGSRAEHDLVTLNEPPEEVQLGLVLSTNLVRNCFSR
jgi:hypothetical protein